MFLIKEEKSYTKKVCPNKHELDIILAVLPGEGMARYCPDCGAELGEEVVHYITYRCSHCMRIIDQHCAFCPYCGEKKEASNGKNL